MDTAIWVEAATVIITVGAGAAIAAGTNQQAGAIRPACICKMTAPARALGPFVDLDELSFAD
jgi:hypothetical protein